METITVKPRNKEEFALVATLMQRMNIPTTSANKKKSAAKKKAKENFLNSLEGRLDEVKLHMDGKIKLKDARDLLNEI